MQIDLTRITNLQKAFVSTTDFLEIMFRNVLNPAHGSECGHLKEPTQVLYT